MKKFFSIFTVAALALLAVASCGKKEEAHVPGAPDVDGCYGVYFPVQEATGYHIYDPTQELTATFTVARKKTTGAITGLPIVVESADKDLFQIGSIDFVDGQAETTFTVDFPAAEEGKEYKLQISVTDPQYASIYNTATTYMDFSFMRVQMQKLKTPDGSADAEVTFTVGSNFLEDQDVTVPYVVSGKIEFYEVDNVRYCKTVTEKGLWGNNKELEFQWYPKMDYKGNQAIHVPFQSTTYSVAVEEGGPEYPVDAMDYFDYFMVGNPQASLAGYTFQKFVQNYGDSYQLSYYDGNGGFYFYNIFNITGSGYWYGSPSNDVLGIASGYSRVDYTLNLKADYPEPAYTPVYVEAGADVKSLKYAVYEGELSKIQIENKLDEIEKDANAAVFDEFEFDEEEGINYGTMLIEAESTGAYTLVALAVDEKGKVQNSASVVFKYVTEADAEDLAVDVNVFTEDTPARYQNYHDYDSFAYGISGTGLTDVHVGIFTEATITKNGADAVFEAVKADAKGTYALSADNLAQVNGEGGFYDVLYGVNAKTTYYVIVWATNGTMDDFAIASYTTNRLPYKWNSLGVGVYTEDVVGGIYGIGAIDVAANVYEEAGTPGLYMIDGFQKNYIATLFVNGLFGSDMVEESADDYEDMLWRNTELIIDATDPANVFIELQDYGICVNTSEGFVDGLTSLYNGKPFSVGTLENGVISFPTAKGMLATINGEGYYYANQHGAFKLVLPTSTPTAPKPASVLGKTINPLGHDAFFKKMVKQTFERDPQPVKVTVTASSARMEKTSGKAIVKAEESIRF